MALASLVTRTQLVLGIAVMGSSLALAAACSSTTTGGTGDGGTSGGTSGATSGGTSGATSGGTSGATSGGTSGGGTVVGQGKCGTSGSTSTCTQAETDAYNSCLTGMCDSQLQAAFGSGYKTGTYSGGACSTYFTCTDACACGDNACKSKCTADMTCLNSLQTLGACTSKCTAPACETGGSDGGTSGTSGTSGGTTHTCADFAACCAAKSGAAQTQCTQAYDAIKANGDAYCNGAFAAYCP